MADPRFTSFSSTKHAHDRSECDEKPRARRFVTCKHCNKKNLVWHQCSKTGNAYSLFESQSPSRPVADTQHPHRCFINPVDVEKTSDAPVTPPPFLENITDAEQIALVARKAAQEFMEQNLPASDGENYGVTDDQLAKLIDAAKDGAKAIAEKRIGEVQAQLTEKIVEELAKTKVLTVEVKSNGEVKRIEGAHKQVPELLYWANATDLQGFRFPVMIFGKPGVSKSYSARQVAEALGLSFGLISLNPQTPESRLFGYKDASGNYHRTLFRDAFENGGLYLIDEIDNASDALLTSLNSCLANGHGAFPDGLVTRHKDFICVATANTPGRGGDANHAGRRPLDAATINRFATIEWENDDVLEAKLVEDTNRENGAAWLTWVRRVRSYCAMHHPRVIVSPRASMMGAKALLDSPFTPEQIADMTLFKGLDKDTKRKILTSCPLPIFPDRMSLPMPSTADDEF